MSAANTAKGRWLVLTYQPTALFSLKLSSATSSVGKTLVVPTPYAIKMALVDAAFRKGYSDEECADLVVALCGVEVRLRPPARVVVTHTFVKIRQESRKGDSDQPYGSNIAYRELVYGDGEWEWAFDLQGARPDLGSSILDLAPVVNYIGKRGSFVQFRGHRFQDGLDHTYSRPLLAGDTWELPARCHVRPLDDFGPEATLERLSSYSTTKVQRARHRAFVDTVIPLGLENTGPGFSYYVAGLPAET